MGLRAGHLFGIGMDSQTLQGEKALDFVLCVKKTYRPILVIELDDSTHVQPDRHARDEFKNTTLAQAGLPLLRIELQKSYNPITLRGDILSMIQKSSSTPLE